MKTFECDAVNRDGLKCNYGVQHSVSHIHFYRDADDRATWVEWKSTPPSRPCEQAWHMGLKWGILTECARTEANHYVHRNIPGDLSWRGKLTDDERRVADGIRERSGK